MLSYTWTIMVGAALCYALVTGRADALAKGAFDGAAQAVDLCLSMAGILCLWSAVMAVMRASGLANGLAKALSPVLSRLFPSAKRDREAMEAISANVSANLLGLGNAATPSGVRAAQRLQALNGGGQTACDDLVTLLVLNTASITIIPATVGGLRASLGASAPFDILLPVWLTSLTAVIFAVTGIKVLQGITQRTGRRGRRPLRMGGKP